jgi:uncharacterized protein YbaP (TraB family)
MRTIIRNLAAHILVLSGLATACPASLADTRTDEAQSNKHSVAGAAPRARVTFDCRGSSILDELKASDPAAHDRILAEANATANANTVFWKIEKDGLHPSYLFGTVHLTDDRVSTMSPTVLDAIGRSRIVLLEVADLSPEATSAALAATAKLALFSAPQSLATLLSPQEFAIVERTLENAGLPPSTARVYRPWIVSMMLSSTACERRNVQSGEPVLDRRIADEAKSRGIEISGLETLESQLQAMASVPEDQQIDMLRAGLSYADRTDDLVETMIELYLSRRMGALWPLQIELAQKSGIGAASFAGFHDALIDRRNTRMRSVAMPHLEKGGAFIAVGALHLSGTTGLVELLRQSGFTLTPAE